jgi:hypothetical protein
MTALIVNRRKLVALAAIVAVSGAAILYAVWRDGGRPDYAVDTAKYITGVSTPPQPIDATVPASPPFMPRSSIVESVGFGPLPRAPLPTDQNDPPSAAISWSTPPVVLALPEIQPPLDVKNLTGLDKIPDLPVVAPATSFSLPSEPSGTTFRLLLPGSATAGAVDSPAGLLGSIPGGVVGTAGGLLPKR